MTRTSLITEGLSLHDRGLEVSPLNRPIVLKSQHNVCYVDCVAADISRQKHAHYEHDPIVDLDFVWTPGRLLRDCVLKEKFSWVIASHVLEHVPDPIGWLLEVCDVLQEGGVISLALPDKNFCFDKFRDDTSLSDLIEAWLRKQSIPSPRQIYDFLSRSVSSSGEPGLRAFEIAKNFEEAARDYTDIQALEFVFYCWTTGKYLDVHCSVFTPESIFNILSKCNELGILNVEVIEPVMGGAEFYVKMIKKGNPSVCHPGRAK